MREIILFSGEMAFVDDEDFERVSKHRWHLTHGYAATKLPGSKNLFMHRLILDAQPGQQIDHANGDRLDNRKCNLRFATNSQNQGNSRKRAGCSSQFKGVHWRHDKKKWQAKFTINRRKYHLGYFTDEVAAAKAYDKAAIKNFGPFARTNFLVET